MIFKNQEQYTFKQLDFSEGSDLAQLLIHNSIEEASATIFQSILAKNEIGYGGYLEKRDIYKQSQIFYDKDLQEYRCIHLGIDLWIEPNAVVISPVHGQIHSLAHNDGYLDYGNTIILECKDKSYTEYILFGHLSDDSLQLHQLGDMIQPGQVIGKIGTSKENGGWVPHLHIQCIKDLEGNTDDYPGIAIERDKEWYKMNCPDPSIFVK